MKVEVKWQLNVLLGLGPGLEQHLLRGWGWRQGPGRSHAWIGQG